jgi:Ca-activated chloride channel family protein
MLALDLSGSMEQMDMQINQRPVTRLTVVKLAANDFIQQRQGDRLGLVLFGTNAYLQTPLTFDRKTVQQMLDDATIGLAGQTTSIGDAIALSVKRLKDTPLDSRVLVLLTDGSNNSGNIEPLKAASIAQKYHIKIYTIGLGAEQQVMNGIFGPQLYNPSQDLDEPLLKEISKLTGGNYFRAKDPKQLAQIYQEITALEPVANDSEQFRPIKPYYYIPLSMAFICFLLLGFLPYFSKLLKWQPRKYHA